MVVLDLTTVDRVKAALGRTEADAATDALLADLIKQVSQKAEDYLNRYTSAERRTEVIQYLPNCPFVTLRGYPIVQVTSLKYSQDHAFTEVDVIDPSDYAVKKNLGQLLLGPSAVPAWSSGWLEVQYTGGMAASTDAFKDAFPDIEFAARMEVINRLNRTKNPDGNLKNIGGEVAYEKQLAPLTDFYAALNPRRRLRP